MNLFMNSVEDMTEIALVLRVFFQLLFWGWWVSSSVACPETIYSCSVIFCSFSRLSMIFKLNFYVKKSKQAPIKWKTDHSTYLLHKLHISRLWYCAENVFRAQHTCLSCWCFTARLTLYSIGFPLSGSIIWNSLPHSCQSVSVFKAFKSSLKNHFFKKYFSLSLCMCVSVGRVVVVECYCECSFLFESVGKWEWSFWCCCWSLIILHVCGGVCVIVHVHMWKSGQRCWCRMNVVSLVSSFVFF